MTQITNQPPNPKLVLLDTSSRQGDRTGLPSVIQFKFQPVDFSMDVGSAWASSTGMNRLHPILQFSHGEQQGFNFSMRLWADSAALSVDSELEALKQATVKDDELKRPPRWQFIWGQFIDETVVVKSIGGVKVDNLRNDGSLRGCTLQISLLIYRSIDVALVSDERKTNTFFSVTKSGDTWEDIALREYDEPAFGDALRQDNPAIPFPGQQIGKIVRLPKLENIRDVLLEPSSIPLVRTADGLALRRDMYAKRSVNRQSVVLKK